MSLIIITTIVIVTITDNNSNNDCVANALSRPVQNKHADLCRING